MTTARLVKATQAVFGRTYELSLTRAYVARWGAVQAIRELIQNALDSESPFVYEFIQDENGLHLRLNSQFATLTPQTLLLGATSKTGSDTAIGSFGEGYKIALLVLTREGFDVDVLNGDLIWKPRFKMSRMFGEDVLVIDEHVSNDKSNKGLTFLVRNLDVDTHQQVIESCLLMQSEIGEVKSTKYGDILLDRPGLLYVGNLFICKTELKYGYNILPKYMRLERDRQTVSSWDLKDTTVKMWYEIGDTPRVAKMIYEGVPDVEYARYDSSTLIKEECYRVFRQNNPDALLARSPEEMRKMIEDGMTKVVYVGGGAYDVISASPSYRSSVVSSKIHHASPHEVLTKWLTDNRSEMRTHAIVAFKSLIKESEKWARK